MPTKLSTSTGDAVNVTAPRPRASTFTIPLNARAPQQNWALLHDTIHKFISPDHYSAFSAMLEALEEDVETDEGLYLGFRRAPAAMRVHHTFEGGLVQHLLEMWDIWQSWTTVRSAVLESKADITDDRVLRAIINHDIHKAYKTYLLVAENPWQVKYGKDRSDQLLTQAQKTLWLLNRHHIELDEVQMNALVLAEGGYSTLGHPRWTSILAKVCYLLDETSGNVLSRLRDGKLLGHNEAPRSEP